MQITAFRRARLVLVFSLSFVGVITPKAFAQPYKLSAANLLLVPIHHPYYPMDDKMLPRLGQMVVSKSTFHLNLQVFANGKELLAILKKATLQYGKIGHLILMGHSGYEGYFAEEGAGFYRDGYIPKTENGMGYRLRPKAATVSELALAIRQKEIVFSDSSVIVLAGCNTALGENNIAIDLMAVTEIPVIGAAQKIDLYDGVLVGTDMLGTENKTFYAYLPDGSSIIKYNLNHAAISIQKALQIVQAKNVSLQLKNSKAFTSQTNN